jgi:hypothetical protein
MNSNKLCVKLFLEDPKALHGVAMVPVFQGWIQMHAVDDHLLIDVADYEHVPDGPGTVLVSHEANFSTDAAGGRPGLLYQRKQPIAGDGAARWTAVLRHALAAAARLETYPGLKFRTDEILLRVADRLLAPNTPATFEAVRPALEEALGRVVGAGKFELAYGGAGRGLFEVTVKVSGAGTVSAWSEKMSAAV